VSDQRNLLAVRRLAHTVLLESLLKTLHEKQMLADVDKLYTDANSLIDGLDDFSAASDNRRGAP
jgi:hypothetical protein